MPDVPIDEQYRLAELIVAILTDPRPPLFAELVLEEYGMTDPARDDCPELPPLAPWTAEEVRHIR